MRRSPRASSSTTMATSVTSGCRRVDQHRQPLDPRRPADRRGVRAAELFDQAVVAAAGEDGALRAKLVGDEFERGVAVIIEPAHEARGEFVGDPGGVEPGADRGEEVLGLGGQDHRRGAVGERAVARVLAVEDAQRVLVEPRLAVLAEIGAVRGEMLDQLRAPRVAAGGVAERVELEPHALDAEFGEQLRAEREQFDVGLRFGGADDLGVELVELAEAALLRALVAEGGAVGRDLERRELLPALAQIGARDPGGEFGAQRDRRRRCGPRTNTFPSTRRRWSRPSSARTPRSVRAPALRRAGSRTGGARGRTRR